MTSAQPAQPSRTRLLRAAEQASTGGDSTRRRQERAYLLQLAGELRSRAAQA